MYDASAAFHEAVRNGKEQKALLIFDDCVFTDEDISVDEGIEFHDYFNLEEDLSIGQTPSNEISFSLFNDDRLLNDYEFGDFLATIGALVGTDRYTQYGNVVVTTQYATYIGNGSYPYVMRSNTILPSQPSFPVTSIAAYDGNVYCFGNDGRYAVYDDASGANVTGSHPLNAFMRKKGAGWKGKGIYFNRNSRILFIYQGGVRKRFEFVPLGWFTAERPKAPDVILIDLTCYDYMQKFEKDMPKAEELGMEYPATIGTLYDSICRYVGVEHIADSFINSGATIQEEPADFEKATMRDVLKWIAEAAGSNARFNRDGKLVLDWLRDTSQNYEATGYKEFNPYWYTTTKVTKVFNRDTQDNEDYTCGDGEEAYLIQDNPLLKGVGTLVERDKREDE